VVCGCIILVVVPVFCMDSVVSEAVPVPVCVAPEPVFCMDVVLVVTLCSAAGCMVVFNIVEFPVSVLFD